MTRLSTAFAMMSALALTSAAAAAEVAPQSGYSIHLGGMDGTVYYTAEADGYRVVATMAIGGSPMRFISTLTAGQRMVVSVPQSVNQPPIEFEILRDGDALRVGEPSSAVTATLASPAPPQSDTGN